MGRRSNKTKPKKKMTKKGESEKRIAGHEICGLLVNCMFVSQTLRCNIRE